MVVGTIVTIINQADVMLGGEATTGTWIKAALNYCAPVKAKYDPDNVFHHNKNIRPG